MSLVITKKKEIMNQEGGNLDEEETNLDIFVKNALKKLNKGGMLIIECSSKETLEGFDKIAKFGDTNLLYWKV